MWFIFRAVDKVLLHSGTRPGQEENEWQACLANEGGVEADFVKVERTGSIPVEQIPVLQDNGTVSVGPNPFRVERDRKMKQARTKLAGLGLTDDEISVLL